MSEITWSTGEFNGLPSCILSSEALRLEFLAEAGPRLVRLSLDGLEDNWLGSVDVAIPTPWGEYRFHGGHRLWYAPEVYPETYYPDNTGLKVTPLPDGARLTQPAEAHTGIVKSIEIHLLPDRPALTLHHHLENTGIAAIELAAWAITQLPVGGLAVIPQPRPNGGGGTGSAQPNRVLALWPYTHLPDPRLEIYPDYWLVRTQDDLPKFKVGSLNRDGWLGYFYKEIFFRKSFEPQADRPHMDYGSNIEIYTDPRAIELETLGPTVRLESGQATTHTETWEFWRTGRMPESIDEVRDILIQLGLETTDTHG